MSRSRVIGCKNVSATLVMRNVEADLGAPYSVELDGEKLTFEFFAPVATKGVGKLRLRLGESQWVTRIEVDDLGPNVNTLTIVQRLDILSAQLS